jgi:hypothetical protein
MMGSRNAISIFWSNYYDDMGKIIVKGRKNAWTHFESANFCGIFDKLYATILAKFLTFFKSFKDLLIKHARILTGKGHCCC